MPISKAKLKLCRSLHSAKGRKGSNLFLIEGAELIKEALREGWDIDEILITNTFGEEEGGRELLKLTELAEVPSAYCSNADMDRMSDAKTPQGAVALAKIPDQRSVASIASSEEILLVCEQISDPGNLGTLLRTADWFGIQYIIVGKGSADPFNPKVVRSTAGAIFRVRIDTADDLADFISSEISSGRKLYAATMTGERLPEDLPRKGLRGLVIGHEKRGVTSEIESLCTSTVRISGSGRTESLNLAVAAGILMYSLTKTGN